MKRTTFMAGAGGVAAALAGAATNPAAAQNQVQSDYTIRQARAQVAGMIAELQTEQTDYGGHRVNAINALKRALNQLNDALAVQGTHPGQRSSDYTLRQVQSQNNAIINNLNGAKADYGGHRVTAISDLQTASSELSAALATQ
jgi:hypothetical protein